MSVPWWGLNDTRNLSDRRNLLLIIATIVLTSFYISRLSAMILMINVEYVLKITPFFTLSYAYCFLIYSTRVPILQIALGITDHSFLHPHPLILKTLFLKTLSSLIFAIALDHCQILGKGYLFAAETQLRLYRFIASPPRWIIESLNSGKGHSTRKSNLQAFK